MVNKEIILAGICGTVVGDAIGVPVEFTSREERRQDPVTDMREYGTHSQPKGTWSDDSSMMLATMESMISGEKIDYADIMEKFRGWRMYADYTPYGNVFDIGITCSRAISQYRPGSDPLKCGGMGERDNGNGSLMRIMPVSLYYAIRPDYWDDSVFREAVKAIQNVSCLTHAHPRSLIACVLYTSVCHELIFREGKSVEEAVSLALEKTLRFYDVNRDSLAQQNQDFPEEIKKDTYYRLRDITGFASLAESQIQSGGYVVHTLEASIWCLLNTSSFSECVLKAVNLGDDTDTTGAVAGGLAGLLYGFEGIPKDWWSIIAKKEWIEEKCEAFSGLL